MDQDGRVLERLQQVGLDRVAQYHGHRSGCEELFGGDWLATLPVADHDPTQPLAQLAQRRRESQTRHDNRGRGDIETGLPDDAVLARAEADDDIAQYAVADVEH